jgi:hypothetical protein
MAAQLEIDVSESGAIPSSAHRTERFEVICKKKSLI